MTTLLHIECSPRKQRSASLEIARQFIARYQHNAPDTQVVTLDLWALDLPEFDGPVMDKVRAYMRAHVAAQVGRGIG